MVMQCCLNSIIVLHLNLSSASCDTLKIPKVISVDLKSIFSFSPDIIQGPPLVACNNLLVIQILMSVQTFEKLSMADKG